MNSFQLLETIGIIIILGFQLLIFFKTKNKISVFKTIFPESEYFEVLKIGLKKEFLELHPKEIFLNLNKIKEESNPKIVEAELLSEGGLLLRPEKYEEDNRIFIDLINLKAEGNYVTEKIIYALNTYLIRNKGVASDFHLIKDVVERNSDTVEEDINQSISLPLYLGLLGTFMGIVFGLFQISGIDFVSNPVALDNAISLLLGGVKIAMIASFTGLLLTVLNSGYFFKGAKAIVEEKKNDFYTFIQTDLLPLLNQNINSTLYSLQNNLHKFNEEFKGNVGMLSSVMGKNHDALIAQEKILTTLDRMDITAFAKANVIVLKELQFSTQKFTEFNQYLTHIGELVANTKGFTIKVNEMMERTENLGSLADKLINVFEENKELAKFLQNHYSSLDNSHQLITQAVNGVSNTLDESLLKLKEFTQERINEVQQITLKEIDLMQNQYPEKWKKLDNLSLLETLNKNLYDIKMSNASQIGSLTSELKSVNEGLAQANLELSAIKKNGTNTVLSKIKGIFKKKSNKKELV